MRLIDHAWRLRHADTRQARGAAAHALSLARARGDALGSAWAALRLALCENILAKDPAGDESRIEHCVADMQAQGDPVGESDAWNLLGNVLASQGRYDEALQAHAACQSLREAIGDDNGVAMSLGNQAISLRALGRWAEALQQGAEGLRLAQRGGKVSATAYARVSLGITHLLAGEAAAAAEHLELAFAAATRTEDRALECTALTRLAQARLHLGALALSRRLLAQAQAIARRTGNVRDAGRVCLVWGLIEAADGRDDLAAVHFDAAEHQAVRCGDMLLMREVDAARSAPGL